MFLDLITLDLFIRKFLFGYLNYFYFYNRISNKLTVSNDLAIGVTDINSGYT